MRIRKFLWSQPPGKELPRVVSMGGILGTFLLAVVGFVKAWVWAAPLDSRVLCGLVGLLYGAIGSGVGFLLGIGFGYLFGYVVGGFASLAARVALAFSRLGARRMKHEALTTFEAQIRGARGTIEKRAVAVTALRTEVTSAQSARSPGDEGSQRLDALKVPLDSMLSTLSHWAHELELAQERIEFQRWQWQVIALTEAIQNPSDVENRRAQLERLRAEPPVRFQHEASELLEKAMARVDGEERRIFVQEEAALFKKASQLIGEFSPLQERRQPRETTARPDVILPLPVSLDADLLGLRIEVQRCLDEAERMSAETSAVEWMRHRT